jgi:hypothetical protein
MTTRELLLREIHGTPEKILTEVYHYLQFLKALPPEDDRFEGLQASQAVLARDWDTPEEDAAWANL